MSKVDVVRAYIGAVERFDVAAMSGLVHPEMRFHEMPNRLKPKGAISDLAEMQVNLPRGTQILRSQCYPITSVVEAGERVLLETRWEGVLAIPLGTLSPGDTMVAHSAMLFSFRDGLIVEQVNYDCYEPF